MVMVVVIVVVVVVVVVVVIVVESAAAVGQWIRHWCHTQQTQVLIPTHSSHHRWCQEGHLYKTHGSC